MSRKNKFWFIAVCVFIVICILFAACYGRVLAGKDNNPTQSSVSGSWDAATGGTAATAPGGTGGLLPTRPTVTIQTNATEPSGSETIPVKPTAPTTAPTAPTTEPTIPLTEPTAPTTEPTAPTTAPTAPTTEPTAPTTEPTVPPTEPTVPPTEPTVPPTEPTVPPTEPTVPPTEPTVPPTEPTVPPTEPTVPPTEPTVPPTTVPPTTAPPTTVPPTTVPPTTVPPTTVPPTTVPPTTVPPTTVPPTTVPSTTVPPTTVPPTTVPPTVAPTEPEGDSPAFSIVLRPEASGVSVKSNDRVIIDYSNTADGYVMIKFIGTTSTRLKVQVLGPTTTYTYNLKVGQWEVFPLSDGSGDYRMRVLENVTGNRYATVLSLSASVTLKDEFAPFIRPNQYVNYENATKTVAQGANLCRGKTKLLDKVKVVYDYVVNTLSYDYDKAATVQSGYLPDLDAVLAAKKGICFDYAALMTGMLRSQGIPCKLVVGYAGTAYHAWISVWSEETGWIDNAVYFDGQVWKRMDPTYASSSNGDQAILDFIKNDANYTTKYLY